MASKWRITHLKDEVPGEGDIRRWGEELLVVQLGLDPLHELVHVLVSRNLSGKACNVSEMISPLISGRMQGAGRKI